MAPSEMLMSCHRRNGSQGSGSVRDRAENVDEIFEFEFRGASFELEGKDDLFVSFPVSARGAAADYELYSVPQGRLCPKTPFDRQYDGATRRKIDPWIPGGQRFSCPYCARQTNVSFSSISNAEAGEDSDMGA
jgi:hypothetical protein